MTWIERALMPNDAASRSKSLRNAGLGSALMVLTSFVLNWPYLRGGFHADDLLFLTMFRQSPLPYERWRGLWSITEVSAFDLWWKEEGATGGFWRPLPSLILEGSIRVFGENALPLHLLSVLAHGAAAAVLLLLVLRLTRNQLLAFLAGLLWVSCEDHSMGVGWIATMTDVLCVLLMNTAMLSFAWWLERRRPWMWLATITSIVLALACKESAVIIAPVLGMMAVFLPNGREDAAQVVSIGWVRERVRSLTRDPMSWAPLVVLFGGYMAAYKGLAPAAMRNLMYLDPLAQPAAYLKHLVLHLPVIWLATFTPVSPSIVLFQPDWLPALAVAGAVTFVIACALFAPMRTRPIVLWAVLSYFLAVLPQLGADASERLLYFPFSFVVIVFAIAASQWGPVARRFLPDAPSAPMRTRTTGAYVLLGILIPGFVMSAVMPFMYLQSMSSPELQTLTAQPVIQQAQTRNVLVLNTSGMFQSFYVAGVLEYHVDPNLHARILSSCNAVMSMERVGEKSFVLRADRPGWLSNMFARIVRVNERLQPGRVYHTKLFSARLLELTPDGTDVLAVLFDLEPDAYRDGLLLLSWDGKRFVRMDLASLPLGEPRVLADASDVWASMM